MPEMIIIEPTANAAERVLRVAAYCRVSSDSEDQLNSYTNQVKHYTQTIGENKAWELVDVYADEGLTGTRADTRPDFQRLLRDCRKGKIDKVLVKSISRAFRNMKDGLASIRELKSLGVEVFFEKEQLDTGAITSEMLLSFFGTLAQEESVSISSNMSWSYQRRMQRGEFITCYAPYGYRLAGRNLIVDEDEAQIVRRIFAEYLSGASVDVIAAALAAEGAPKRNDYWSTETVKFILRNEKYAGNVLLQKSYTTNIFPYKRARNRGERDMYYIENSHPPIISLETFEQVCRLRQIRLCHQNRPVQHHPFKLKIVCGECGYSFKRHTCRGKAYWVCWRHCADASTCSVKQIPEPFLEDAFVRLWNKLRNHRYDILHPMLDQLETLKERASKRNKRLYELDTQINTFIQKNHVLHLLRSKGYMDSALFMTKYNELSSNIAALRRERQRLLTNNDDEAITATRTLLGILETGPKELQGFDEGCFNSIVDKIIAVSQTEVRFRLLNGLELTEAVEKIGRWAA